MEKRAEPRIEAEMPVRITLLGDQQVTFTAHMVNLSGRGMRLLMDRSVDVGAPVGVEWDDSLVLGDVCYCEPAPGGYAIGLELEQRLLQTSDLVQLARQLAGDPERPSDSTPSSGAPERRQERRSA